MTKLVLAIINNDDSAIATSALNAEGFFVTRLSTTGGFLTVGNTTLLIGTEDGKVERIKEILSRPCATRRQLNPSSQNYGKGLKSFSPADEVTVGGATLFVLGVEQLEKL